MILGFNPFGYEGSVVTVEVDLRKGIPAVDIVGLADGAAKESRERVRTAIKNCGFEFPTERVLISLSPADLKKESGFDLAMALAILSAKDDWPRSQDAKVLVMGELELSGKIRPVRAVYAAVQSAIKEGIKYAIVPEACEELPDGIVAIRVKTLMDAVWELQKIDEFESIGGDGYDYQKAKPKEEKPEQEFSEVDESDSLDLIEDKNGLKFAMMVAAAGGHHLLASGKMGCGKSYMLQRFGQLLPRLTKEEAESVNRVYSVAGMPRTNRERPFRQPHPSASLEGMCGGGIGCRPGEMTLAHNGVLFLDEAAEFRSSVLQMMRVPLESHTICMPRAGRTTIYPANFQLLIATNPCPCGNYGSKDKMCLCSARAVEAYWRKFSAPLLDRIAIRYDMNNPIDEKAMTIAEMREKIKTAVLRQRERGLKNQDIPSESVDSFLTEDTKRYVEKVAKERDLSPRGIADLVRVAVTVADLEGRDIEERDIETASRLRGVLPMDLGL